MINLPTKFEVPSFLRYGDMKDVQKRPKMGWFGVVMGHPRSSEMSPFGRAHTTSYSTLIETRAGKNLKNLENFSRFYLF